MMTLVNPPSPPDTVSNKDTMGGLGQLYGSGSDAGIPPYDILATAAVLRQLSLPVTVVECLGSGLDCFGLVARLREIGPRYTALRTSTPSFNWDIQVAEMIVRYIDTEIILFGPHVIYAVDEALSSPAISAVVIGEAEAILPKVQLQGLSASVPGVITRSDERSSGIPPVVTVDDLDELPFPAWDLLPYKSYAGTALMRHLHPCVTMLSSRGCPHGCSYCPYPVIQGRRLRMRSPESVVEEMVWLDKKLSVKGVLFRDPEFAINTERVKNICSGLIEKKVTIKWRCETRMENLTPELIRIMGRAGCIGINMGVESADSEVLQRMGRKPLTLDHSRDLLRVCDSYGIETFCFFIIGLPGETRKSALRTINYAMRLNPSFAQFTVATPYPGTALRKWAVEQGYLEEHALECLTGYNVTMRTEHLSRQEIQSLLDYAGTAWSMRGGQVRNRIVGHLRGAVSELFRWSKFVVRL